MQERVQGQSQEADSHSHRCLHRESRPLLHKCPDHPLKSDPEMQSSSAVIQGVLWLRPESPDSDSDYETSWSQMEKREYVFLPFCQNFQVLLDSVGV